MSVCSVCNLQMFEKTFKEYSIAEKKYITSLNIICPNCLNQAKAKYLAKLDTKGERIAQIIYLDVLEEDKQIVRRLGGQWNGERFFILPDAVLDVSRFEKWITTKLQLEGSSHHKEVEQKVMEVKKKAVGQPVKSPLRPVV